MDLWGLTRKTIDDWERHLAARAPRAAAWLAAEVALTADQKSHCNQRGLQLQLAALAPFSPEGLPMAFDIPEGIVQEVDRFYRPYGQDRLIQAVQSPMHAPKPEREAIWFHVAPKLFPSGSRFYRRARRLYLALHLMEQRALDELAFQPQVEPLD